MFLRLGLAVIAPLGIGAFRDTRRLAESLIPKWEKLPRHCGKRRSLGER